MLAIKIGDRFKPTNIGRNVFEVTDAVAGKVQVKVVGATSMFKDGVLPFWVSPRHPILDECWLEKEDEWLL